MIPVRRSDPHRHRAIPALLAAARSSAEQYRRPYGRLVGRRELAGRNPAGGSLRLAVGLAEMLRALSV